MTDGPLRDSDPRQLGGYRLVARLGSGGMGVVYRGLDSAGRPVAVKVIHPHLADAPEFLHRFRSEAGLAQRVARFSTAAVLDADVDGDRPYLVTEFIEGPTLQEAVDGGGPLAGGELDAVAIGIATALIAIHGAGVVHRDLKPGNVILTRSGPRVIDFGIARAMEAATTGGGAARLTAAGGFVGSPPYMAPEQFRGEAVGAAADVYAWGAVVCFAATGRPPFGVDGAEVMLYRALHAEPELTTLSPELRAPVAAALGKKPAGRPSAAELHATLTGRATTLVTPPPVTPPPVTPPPGAATTAGGRSEPGGPMTLLAEPATEPAPRRRRPLLVAAAAVVALVLAGLAPAGIAGRLPGRDGGHPTPADGRVRPVGADDRATGPAPAVPGAVRGGTVTVYASSESWGRDLAANDLPDALMANSRLLLRTLTAYRDTGSGAPTLVGDLATDTGRSTDGGRTWRFTLRQGVTFENGAAVTAHDVARGIAWSFRRGLTGGTTYLQRWLTGASGADYRTVYSGPTAARPYPPGVEVPDARTLVLRFPAPHPDLPSVATQLSTAPVPNTGRRPDRPLSTGPYQIVSWTRATLVLGRNPRWRPASDPVRTDYPDRYTIRFGTPGATVTAALVADSGPDTSAVQLGNVDANQVRAVYSGTAKARLVVGHGSYHRDLCLNTGRITSVEVRRALARAFDRESALEAFGGAYAGDLTTSLLSPLVPGYPDGAVPAAARNGDPAGARATLAGRTIQLGYRDAFGGKRFAEATRDAFAAAGVQVTLAQIDPDRYDAVIGGRDNAYDAYLCSWGPDYLDGNAMLPLLYRGADIRADGNTNVSYLDDPAIDREIDRLAVLADRTEAAAGYVRLERRIREEHAPAVPFYDQRRLALRGSAVGGLFVSRIWGVPDLSRTWLTT